MSASRETEVATLLVTDSDVTRQVHSGGVGGVRLDTPIGPVAAEVDETGVRGIRLASGEDAGDAAVPVDQLLAPDGLLAATVAQLRQYFAGQRTDFDLPLVVTRGSAFERAVWAELRLIPYGMTRTYGEVAHAVGEPGAARAVGVACHRNPLPLLVPCHRVVGAGGKLVGFGGGLPRKRWLLEHEAGVALQRAWS